MKTKKYGSRTAIKLIAFAVLFSANTANSQQPNADEAYLLYLKNHSTSVQRTLERIEKYAESGRRSMKCCYYTFNGKHVKIFRELGYEVELIKREEGYRYWDPEKYRISW